VLKIQKYLLKEILGFFFLSLLTFTGLLLTVRMLKLAGLIIKIASIKLPVKRQGRHLKAVAE